MSRRRKKPSGRPGGVQGSKTARKFLRQFQNGPVFPSDNTINHAAEYLSAFAHFEEWILYGTPENYLDFAALPAEHRFMMEYWPEAFEVYRHSMWAYLEHAAALNPWSSTIRSLMMRARASDAAGFEEFLNQIDNALPKFIGQKRNAVQSQREVANSTDELSSVRASLQSYANYYEIDFPMWFLAVLGKAVKSGHVQPAAFGGPGSTVPQGSLIDSATSALSGTPLELYMREAFDPDLRNTIQHNDYEIQIADDGPLLTRLDGSMSWDGQALSKCVYGTTQIVEAVQSVAAYIRMVEEPRLQAQFSQVGIVGVLYMAPIDLLPHAVLLQLWCFHEMDMAGTWLDSCTVEFEHVDDLTEKVKFTEHAYTVGEPILTQLQNDGQNIGEWMRVTRLPVAPDLELGHPTIERPDHARYEIIGPSDTHVVRVGASGNRAP